MEQMDVSRMRIMHNYNVLLSNSILISGLFSAFTLFFLSFYLPTQIYGSARSADSCSLSANQTCQERPLTSNSAAMSDSDQKDAEIPLILPDISPKGTDINDIEDGEDAKKTDSDRFRDTDSRDSPGDNRDPHEERRKEINNEEAGDSGGDGSDSNPSSLPFP
jgi:hypothetical protein